MSETLPKQLGKAYWIMCSPFATKEAYVHTKSFTLAKKITRAVLGFLSTFSMSGYIKRKQFKKCCHKWVINVNYFC